MWRRLGILPLITVPFLVHCSDFSTTDGPAPLGDDAGDGGEGGDGATGEVDPPLVPTDKVDILFVVDNSASMGDKQSLLATSVDSLLRRLVVEQKITDIHVGIISSSLGPMGGDICSTDGRFDDHAHLLALKKGGGTVANAQNGVFTLALSGNVDQLIADTRDAIVGVDQTGCGLEAQLEAMYRFLVQPDPWLSITAGTGAWEGVDDVLLAQRKAFLRPDSALAVIMISDEDDSNVDPQSLGGNGWKWVTRTFPGSTVVRGDPRNGSTAPRATSACATDPDSPDCKSCADTDHSDPSCQINGGYYGATEDNLNVRFTNMKRRFGVDPQFPIDRYVKGLTERTAPKRETQHDPTTGVYTHSPTCTNPIFAKTLPGSAAEELCNLVDGDRSKRLIAFHLIGGAPPALAKEVLGPSDWPGLFSDPHMTVSITARPGLPPPTDTRGDNGTDPVHGREWDTRSDDLQYACTFALPQLRTCTVQDSSCDCAISDKNPPLCGANLGDQLRGKAYPTLRELRVAEGLGERGLVSSLCNVDPARGYSPALDRLVDRIAPVLKK